MRRILQYSRRPINAYRNIIGDMTFSPYVIQKKMGDVDFQFMIADPSGRDWYEDAGESFKLSFIRQNIACGGDIVFECGGHHGYTAVLMSKWVGHGGKVVSFEPNEKNADIIEENIKLNGLTNVYVERKAIGSFDGEAELVRRSNASMLPSTMPLGALKLAKTVYGSEKSQVVTLDSYAEMTGLRPTAIKVDVEGYELEVLKGARDILSGLPKLCIEIHTDILFRYGASVAAILGSIDLEQYHCWVQWEESEAPKEYLPGTKIDKRVNFFAVRR